MRVYHARRIDDERENLSFGFLDINAEDLNALLQRIAEGEKRRHERIAEFIEPTMTRGIYEVFAEIDLS